MNCLNMLGNILRPTVSPFLTSPSSVLVQQTRNTYVLKRRHQPSLYKKNANPHYFKHKHFIYDVVENRSLLPRPPLDIILTTMVEGIGERGDKITMPSMRAYNHFLLPGLAVYATPENIKKWEPSDESTVKKAFSSPFVPRMINYLTPFLLSVTVSYHNPWTLEKWHVRSAFRRSGIYLNDDCITMPSRPISGPNLDIENKEFYVTVTINKTETVNVRSRIKHCSNDAQNPLPCDEYANCKLADPIFPEDKPILDAMPVHYPRKMALEKGDVPAEIQ